MLRPSIPALLAAPTPAFSFEFFPPKDDAAEETLWHAVRRLEPLAPAFVSVTYGAGGSTRGRTVRVTERISNETTMRPMAHLTCVGSSVDQLREVIGQYASGGVRDLLALRGDPPGGPGAAWTPHPQGLDHAADLVRLVRSLGDFTVGVAAFPDKHPEAADLASDADALAGKFDAGADFAVTQFVFDVGSYARLRDLMDLRGYAEPIVPGLMPVTSFRQVSRMAELSGTPLPPAVVARLAAVEDDPAALAATGVAIATELGEALLTEGAPGLHFYTMNKSTASLQVHANLVGTDLDVGLSLSVDAAASGRSRSGRSQEGLLQGGAVAAVRRFVEAVGASDWPAVEEALSPEVVVTFPARYRRTTGVESAVRALRSVPGAWRIERMVYDGARQVVVWCSRPGAAPHTSGHDVAFVTLDALGRIEAVVMLSVGA